MAAERTRDRHAKRGEEPALQIGFVVALVGFLVLWNNVANLVPAFDDWYVLVNLAVAAAIVWGARRAGHRWHDLGLARERLPSGLAWGGAAFALVALVLAVALAVPATRPLLADGRMAGMSGSGVAFLALVRIPLGTVVLEEVAFRGVLLGALQRRWGRVAAVLGSSAVFGLWHITPTIEMLDANQLAADPMARVAALAGAVALTAGAGVLFSLLRIASGSVVAPMLAHTATNSLAALAAYAVM